MAQYTYKKYYKYTKINLNVFINIFENKTPETNNKNLFGKLF